MIDLRDALKTLDGMGELRHVREPVAAAHGVSAAYAAYSGVPARPPTGPGPAMLFHDVRPGHGRVALGIFGTRRRCAALVGTRPENLADRLAHAAGHPVAPATADRPVPRTWMPQVDLGRLPLLTAGPHDAGPYLSLGLVLATHPETQQRNASVHRMAVQGPDTLTIWMVPGRHLESCYRAALAAGSPLPVAVHLGLDPAVYLASCISTRIAPLGVDELAAAGALRGAPVLLSPCADVAAEFVDNAEWVIEAEITAARQPENRGRPQRGSMPEFLGYDGAAHPDLPVVRVRAVSRRESPILQAVVGPGYEQSNLLAFGAEAGIRARLADLGAPRVTGVHCGAGGGGQLLVFVRVDKTCAADDGDVREAGLELLRGDRMIKTVVLVDDDVELADAEDVWWAVTTRMRADRDLVVLPDQEGFPLDPSQSPEFSPTLSAAGRTAKILLDATVPYRLRSAFRRSDLGTGVVDPV